MGPKAKTEAAVGYVKDTVGKMAVNAFPAGKATCNKETLTRNLMQMNGLLDMALVVQSLTTFNGTQVTKQDFEAVFGDGSKKKANRP